jgi:hypothetical protein
MSMAFSIAVTRGLYEAMLAAANDKGAFAFLAHRAGQAG